MGASVRSSKTRSSAFLMFAVGSSAEARRRDEVKAAEGDQRWGRHPGWYRFVDVAGHHRSCLDVYRARIASALPVARQRDRRGPLSHVIATVLCAVAIVGSSSLSAAVLPPGA
jgi:hypothetical protein